MSNFQTVREWDFSVVVSLTKVGDIIRVTSRRILLTPTGDARACLDMGLISARDIVFRPSTHLWSVLRRH